MSLRVDDQLIESIVAGVMDRLRERAAPSATAPVTNARPTQTATQAATLKTPADDEPIRILSRVVTEAVLEDQLAGKRLVQFAANSVLTPTARDYLRIHKIEWSRGAAPGGNAAPTDAPRILAIVVHEAATIQSILRDRLPGARQELLGCVDDAARLAAAELARGAVDTVFIFARQTHRAVCLANRQRAVRAAAPRDLMDISLIRAQLRVNTWCLDPTGRGPFELRNMLKTIAEDWKRAKD